MISLASINSASCEIALQLSVVIPVYNGGEPFRQCLASVAEWGAAAVEVIVVDDGSTDDSAQVAKAFGAKLISLQKSGGPAQARNLGAEAATGDLLFFLDADVSLHPDTLTRAIHVFETEPQLAALIGSYDDAPGAANFLSQYRNLLHHYMHQTANPNASTFWGACGVIRRDVFWAIGSFDPSYRQPCIEDIELGYRLKRHGYQIRLDRSVQVKHLKRWQAASLLRADFFYRALPWTELIWRDRQLVNDLNLNTNSRVSVVAVYGLVAALILSLWQIKALLLVFMLSMLLLLVNAPVYQFFLRLRGPGFTLRVLPWHWLYYGYSGLAFAIGTALYWLRSWRHWKPLAVPMKLVMAFTSKV
jgi:glycosyltransferase involved in cell wall biosynthesis